MVYKSIKKHGAKCVTPSVNHTIRWFLRPKFRVSGLKTQMERESSKEYSVLFLWIRKAFGYEIVF